MNILRKLILIVLIGIMGLNISAQKKELKASDPYKNRAVYPVNMSQLQWIPNTSEYTYVSNNAVIKSSYKSKEDTLLKVDKLNQAFANAGLKPVKRMPQLSWYDEGIFSFVKADSLYTYDLKLNQISLVCYFPVRSEVIKFEKNKKQVAYTRENNLYIYRKGKEVAVTEHTNNDIVSGQTVSRSEFGITHGIFWSPEGSLLAFYTKDQTKVTDYPLVNIDTRIAEVENTKYPMAGMETEVVTVNVYNPKKKKTITLETDPKQYLTNISWSPDEKYIFIAVLNREQNHLWLNKYDAKNGKFLQTLFEENHSKYVEPEEGLHFLNNSKDEFVWFSERDGYYHAYLYNTDGTLIKQLTKGEWVVTEFLGFNKKNSQMFFMATKESPIQRHLYNLNMKDGSINKLTDTHGTHRVSLNDKKDYFTDVFSNYTDIAKEYRLYNTKGKLKKVLKENNSPLKEFNMGETTISTLKADDGTDLYYRMIKPANFDPNKKYPVIIYVYGGPHAQLITDSWMGGSGFFLQYIATQGYVVFTLDNRGSANRGFVFESIIHRQLGVVEMKDQMVGVDYLKSLSFVDTARIGVNGWSFGGFMTTSLISTYPKTFKVGVAGGPVIDWKYYEIMYGERYMDTPQENPEGYKNANLLNKIDNLEGNLLLIHGALDATVVWQHSLQYIKMSVKKQKQVDYFVYPDHEHNVRGIDRLHLESKIIRYFNDYL